MKNSGIKHTFYLGKIAYANPNRRANAVEVDLELRNRGGRPVFSTNPETNEKICTSITPRYLELSICATVWNQTKTQPFCCGQCLDRIAEYRTQLENPELFDTLFELWKKYHLNGLHAGTPEQEALVDEWTKTHPYEYSAACKMLKEKGAYIVNYTGLSHAKRYDNEPYEYGHGWLVRELPPEVVAQVKSLVYEYLREKMR